MNRPIDPIMELSFRSILDALPCYITLLDSNFTILYANQALESDFGRAQSKTCYTLLRDLQQRCESCLVADTFSDGQIHVGEGELKLPDGRQHQIVICTTPLLDVLGNVTAVIKIAFNIDKIKKIHQELIMLGQSMAVLSHDIKNILEGLQGGAYVVDEGIKDEDMVLAGKGWHIVKKNIFEITRIAQNILFSSKKRDPEYKEVKPGKIVRDVINLYKEKAATMGIQLINEIDPNLPLVKMDRVSMTRLLGNLVWNAIEACGKAAGKETKIVNVRAGYYDKYHYMLEVEDNGKGMDPSTQQHLFQEFYTTKGNAGTGLGLIVVDRIIKQHGGKIDVLSKLGTGSLFRAVFDIK